MEVKSKVFEIVASVCETEVSFVTEESTIEIFRNGTLWDI